MYRLWVSLTLRSVVVVRGAATMPVARRLFTRMFASRSMRLSNVGVAPFAPSEVSVTPVAFLMPLGSGAVPDP